jgi:CubicO group peptidase (beta-lactamase class C family)
MTQSIATKNFFCPIVLLMASLLPAMHGAAAPGSERVFAPTVEPVVQNGSLAGAVMCVATKDKILDLETAGFCDVAARTPMKPDAVFWIASQSKPIAATALMMLVDEGRVNLDDPVEKYLPEFKGQMVIAERDSDHELLRKPVHPIRVREVLSHTSGIPFSSPIEHPTLDMLPLSVAVRSHAMSPLQFEPGSKYQYSNAGINTAARIIEVVSGMPYQDFLAQRLFAPLGMKDTTFWPSEQQLKRLAKSYKPNEAKSGLEETPITQLHYPLDDPHRQPMPAGGLFSTAADLVRFCQMVLNGGILDGRRYLSEAAVKEMTSKQTGPNISEGYGLGWSVRDNSFGHGGAYATNMSIDRKSGLILIWLVQHSGFPGDGAKAQDAFRRAANEHFARQ